MLEPSRKRQEPDDSRDNPQPQLKRPRLDQPSSAYWDTLSKIWLTRDALEELNRRNRASNSDPRPSGSRRRPPSQPLTRQLQSRLKYRCQTLAPDPLISCKPESVRKIKRLSRRGGLDLSDLRNFPEPYIPFYQSMSTNSLGNRKRRAGTPLDNGDNGKDKTTTKITKTTTTSPYNRNFEQKLIDHGIYPPGYKYPNGQKLAKPSNWVELNERLVQPRASLSPSRFSEREFEEFVDADLNASKEKPVVRLAIPIIEGRVDDVRCMGGDYPFNNLAPLTDSDGPLANAKPDHLFGARPEQLDPKIRSELSNFIVPSTQDSLPILPNFFLETKGPDGLPVVTTRQVCHDGALGARGIHKIQSYKDKPVYDNNAYTITSTYQAGQLKLYTTHLTPRDNGRPEYVMTPLRSFAMTDNPDTFRSGACAYRNARDWAKEQRDKFIQAANERHTLSSEHEAISEPTVVLEDSDTPATSDEAEFQDAAQWSVAQPDDDPQASNKGARTKPKPTNNTGRKPLPN